LPGLDLRRPVQRLHPQDAGVLRADLSDEDVVLLLMANAGLVERASAWAW
jgi:hypothetical protein